MIEHIPQWMMLLFVFFYASVITSFLCLAVDRLPHQLKWREEPDENLTIYSPPSHCNECKTKIRWWGLIPIIGYLLCKGKCLNCNVKISIVYPLSELCCSLTCVIIFWKIQDFQTSLILCSIFLCLFFLSFIDIREQWLPACVTIPLFWSGLVFSYFAEPESKILGACTGFFIMYLSMKIVSHMKKDDVVAGGDIALSCAAGAWLGVDEVMIFLLISSVIFLLYSIPYRFKGTVFVPMGPALSVGFFICLLRVI